MRAAKLLAFAREPSQTAEGDRGDRHAMTQINTNVSAMTDAELADYRHLLAELKRVMPAAPKAIEGIVTR